MTVEEARPLLEHARAEGASAAIALTRLMLAGVPAAAVPELLRRCRERDATARDWLDALAAEAEAARPGLATVQALVEAGADHRPATDATAGVAANRALFDRLVRISPEASVAAYSLGDPARLRAATEEVVTWLETVGLLRSAPAILDLGCGIGRFTARLAPHASRVVGLDVSEGMLARAAAACAGLDNVGLVRTTGHGLDGLADASFDLVLAADTFPYLVQAAPALADRHLRDAARVLRPGGSLVVLNASYRGIEADRCWIADAARALRLAVRRSGTAEFRLWDAAVFWLVRPSEGER